MVATELDGQAVDLVTDYAYDGAGDLHATTAQNGGGTADEVVTTYTYDTLNRLTDELVQRGGAATLFSQHFILGDDGQKQSVLEQTADGQTVLTKWSYDADGRLTGETRDVGTDGQDTAAGDYVDGYKYDLAGNRVLATADRTGGTCGTCAGGWSGWTRTVWGHGRRRGRHLQLRRGRRAGRVGRIRRGHHRLFAGRGRICWCTGTVTGAPDVPLAASTVIVRATPSAATVRKELVSKPALGYAAAEGSSMTIRSGRSDRSVAERLEERRMLSGTVVRDLGVAVPSYAGAEHAVVNGVSYFAGETPGSSDEELWRTDGTPAGTYRVRDITPGPGGSTLEYLTNCNGLLFFTAFDGGGR